MADYYFIKGQIMDNMNKSDEAIREYSKCLDYDPLFYKASYARASLYNQSGEYDKAINDYNSAIKSDQKTK